MTEHIAADYAELTYMLDRLDEDLRNLAATARSSDKIDTAVGIELSLNNLRDARLRHDNNRTLRQLRKPR